MLDVDQADGRAVWPMFREDFHVARTALKPQDDVPVVVGFDTSGIHPAAVFSQFADGRWRIIDEVEGAEEGLESFMESGLMAVLRTRYNRCRVVVVSVDPANARDSYTGLAPTDHLRAAKLRVHLPSTNRPETRVAAVASLLNKDKGGILVSPA